MYALNFTYDEQGKPFTLSYDNGSGVLSHYYYYVSYQGDVLGLLTPEGALAATYLYDAWGNLLEDELTLIGSLNPIRYRSYYYESNLSLYYLQSRYYDSTTGRFISTDSTDYLDLSHLQGMNLYTYGLNNPVMHTDPSGTCVLVAILLGITIGAIVGAAAYSLSVTITWVITGTFDWSWALFFGSTIGGAVGGGLAAYGLAGILAAGIAGSVSTYTGMLYQNMWEGTRYEFGAIMRDSLIAGGVSMVAYAMMNAIKINHINKGAGSLSSISKQIFTKLKRNLISRISLQTFSKMLAIEAYSNVLNVTFGIINSLVPDSKYYSTFLTTRLYTIQGGY